MRSTATVPASGRAAPRRDKLLDKLMLLDNWLTSLSLLGVVKFGGALSGAGVVTPSWRRGRPSELRRRVGLLSPQPAAPAAPPLADETDTLTALLFSSAEAALIQQQQLATATDGGEDVTIDFAALFNEALSSGSGGGSTVDAVARDRLLLALAASPPIRGYTWMLRHMLGLAGVPEAYNQLFSGAALGASRGDTQR